MAAKNIGTHHLNRLTNLPDHLTIDRIIRHEHCDEYFVSFVPPDIRRCPCCGSNDCVIKDSGYTQTVRHTASHGRGTLVTFHKRRLRCKDCGHSFFENPDWIHPALHMTLALYCQLAMDLMQKSAIKAIAETNCVSPAVVSSVLNSISFGLPRHLPETLCIDEFKGSSGEWQSGHSRWHVNRYHCSIVNGSGEKGYAYAVQIAQQNRRN